MFKKMLCLSVVFQLSACGLFDYTAELKNGYKYNDWGNRFISREADGETRQIVHGQVLDYVRSGDFLLVLQKTSDNYLETGQLNEPLK